jgi:hypothetical protein
LKNSDEKAVRFVAYLEAAKGKRSVIPIALEDVDA